MTNNNQSNPWNPWAYSFLLFSFIFSFATVHAQSAATEIETLLQTPAITYAQAARLVLDASNVLTTQNREAAFNYAMEQNWVPQNATADQNARLDTISLLCMKAFDIKGGILFSLTNSPHYAYREMRYLNAIHGRVWPSMEMSGDMLLFMISRLLDHQERVTTARRESLAARISAMLRDVAATRAEATNQGVVITLTDIQFLADSAEIPDSERAKLQEIAEILRRIRNVRLLVAGHTALAGTEEGRNTISLERARAVADYLVSLRAVRARNVTAVGYGADRPIADNSTAAGMAANRRVEIIILDR